MTTIEQEFLRIKRNREKSPPASHVQQDYWKVTFAQSVVNHNTVPETCGHCMFYGPFTDLCWLSEEEDKWTCEVTDFLKYILEHI